MLLEIETLEARALLDASPISVVNVPTFLNDTLAFQVAFQEAGEQTRGERADVSSSPYVEVEIGAAFDASGLEARWGDAPLELFRVEYDAAGNASSAHPLTGQALAPDAARAGRTVAIVDLPGAGALSEAAALTFAGLRFREGAPSSDTSVTAQGRFRLRAETTAAPRELIVVSADVTDADTLVQQFTQSRAGAVQVLRLGAGDGLDAVTRYLRASDAPFAAVHLLGHGSAGTAWIGATQLSAGNDALAGQFAQWRSRLTAGADVLFYACDLAATAEGRALVRQVSEWTGADAAASTDVTGAASLGGDWDLEYAIGTIEAAASAANWDGTLAPIQFFYVPMPEQETRAALDLISTATAGNDETSVIAISITENNTVLYYDHWEDGYETNLAAPTQATTQIWGDNDASNGIAPGYATDVLDAGDVIRLRNNVPANPRNPANQFFDARDKIGSSKTIAMSRAQFPVSPGSVIASAVEVRDTRYFDLAFTAPVGTNTPNSGTMFSYTAFFVMAAEDDTTVQIDRDDNGVFEQTVTLDQGENVVSANNVLQGGRVVANKPVQVHLLTGQLNSTHAARSYSLFSDGQLTNDYFTPVGQVNSPVHLFVYNPNASAITVNFETQTTSGSLGSIAAGGAARFVVPANTGTRLFSASNFTVLGANDAQGSTYDWGFSLQPVNSLSQFAIVGLGVGNSTNPPAGSGNHSPVWVTPLSAVRIYVDFDGDQTTGALVDPLGNRYDQHFDLARLQSQRVRDTSDDDNSGMRLYTLDGTLISVAWGEDSSTAPGGSPGFDAGTTVPALPVPEFYKFADFAPGGDLNGDGYFNAGDVVRYTLRIRNIGTQPVTNATLSDVFPASYLTYVANSSFIDQGLGATAIPDAGATFLPLDEGGYAIPSIAAGTTTTVTFDATVNSGLPSSLTSITNQGRLAFDIFTLPATVTIGVRGWIGDRVWYDVDGDGAQDAGEPGIVGATVTLTWSGPDDSLGNGDDVVYTTTTGANGAYSFANLYGGNYGIAVSGQPNGLTTLTTGSSTVTLAAGELRTDVDFGYRGAASSGDFVWNDANANGLQTGESGLVGATVDLVWAGQDGTFGNADDVAHPTFTTAGAGAYAFANLPSGAYRATFAPPTGYAITTANVGGNAAIDSDANAGTGVIAFSLGIGETNVTFDVGMYAIPTVAVNDVTATEGTDGFAVFAVTLSGPSPTAVSVSLALAGVTAGDSGVDFGTAGAGNLQVFDGVSFVDATSATFAPGTTSIQVRTPIVNDTLDELDETFNLTATVTAGTTTNANATGVGTIVDDDSANFTINDVVVNEGAGTATFTVTLTGDTALTSTVDFATADVVAGAADYGPTTGTLTFAPGTGVRTQTIVVTIANDGFYEGSETFAVNLSNPSNALIADAQGIGTILDDGTGPGGTDDDRPVYTVDDVTRNEAGGTITFTVTLTGDTNLASTVDFATASDTATSGADFTSTTGTLTFAAGTGTRTQTVSVPIANDTTYEGIETFFLNLSNSTNARIVDDIGVGTIFDDGTGPGGTNDDRPVYTIDDVTRNEAAGTITFTVTLTGGTLLSSTVNYATASNSATSGADFTSTSGSLTFAPGAGTRTQSVTVPIANDATFEASETFFLDLSGATNAVIGDAQGVGTIVDDGTGPGGTDDDRPTVSVNDVSVTEGVDGFAIFTVSLSNASAFPISVSLALTDVQATGGGVDFGAAGAGNLQVLVGATFVDATSATFAPGTTSIQVRTPIVDDTLYELTEDFTLDVAVTAGQTANTSALGTGFIASDDPQPSYSVDDVTVNESAGTATFTITLAGDTAFSSTVDWSSNDGTALSPGDYGFVGGTLAFAAGTGTRTQTVTVPIVNDAVGEPIETFQLNLGNATNAGILDSQGLGTILDDDAPNFSVNDVTVNEGAGSVTFTVTLTGDTVLASSVTYATAPNTASTGIDFTPASGTLNFAPGNGTRTQSVTVPITNDSLFELSETFFLNLSGAVNAAISDAQGVGTILDDGTGPGGTDDDRPVYTVDDVTRNEAGGTITFTVTLTGDTALSSTVDFATASNTATSGVDFTGTGGTLTFAAGTGTRTQTVTVPIANDTTFEGSETFFLNLTNATNATIGDAQGVGTIFDDGTGPGGTDDDRPVYTVDDVTRNEAGGTITFTVTLTGDTNLSSTVDFATASDAATSGADFTSTSGTLTFLAGTGTRTQTVTVPITNDATYEGSESFFLNLSNATNARIVDDIGVGTIFDDGTGPGGTDDDRPVYTVDDVTRNEAGGTITFTLTLTGDTALSSTANYATASNTASTGLDFTSTTGTLTFAPGTGTRTQTVTVPITNDTTFEGSETFFLDLSSATNAIIGDAQGVGTIFDDGTGPGGTDDDRPIYTVDDVTRNEAGGTITFTVTLTGDTALLSTVDFATTNDTATGGTDFTSTTGTLTFGAGSGTRTQIVSVPIANDNLYELSETFFLNLSNATNAGISDNIGIGTILDDGTGPGGTDDDRPSYTVDDVTVSESDGTLTFTVTLTGDTALASSVNYATADASALDVADFSALSGTLTFAAGTGTRTQTVVVPITSDSVGEPLETFNLNLSGAVNAVVGDAQGVGTILDDDSPNVSVDDVIVNEAAGTLTFTVILVGDTTLTSTVDFATADVSAGAADYTPTTGTVTFAPGAGTRTQTVTVAIANDGFFEGSETFALNLTNATNSTIADNLGVGTILDDGTGPGGTDDDRPVYTVDDVTVNEAAGTLTFTVTLTGDTNLSSSVDFATASNSATSGADFTLTSGTLTFAPGSGARTQTVTVPIANDSLFELSESFLLNLSNSTNARIVDDIGIGTILDDGTGPGGTDDDRPTYTVDDVTVNEAAGTLTFTITLAGDTALSSTVAYATADGAATSAADYTSTSGTLTFAPGTGSRTQTVTVPIANDSLFELSENFVLNLSGATNAVVSDAQGVGTILDDGTGPGGTDDDRPTYTVDDVTVNEAAGTLTFTVTLAGDTALSSTVAYATADVTAGALDYTATAGTLTFLAGTGTRTQTVVVPIANDGFFESSETFTLNLTSPTNAVISDAQGIGTILDDGTGPGGTDDDRPVYTVDDVTVNEAAGTLTFTVTLTGDTNLSSTVDFATAPGTATAADFTGATGTLTFVPGSGARTQTVTVAIANDSLFELSENFTLNLSNATNARIVDDIGFATILDDGTGPGGIDDDRPSYTVDDVTVNEAAGTLTFTVTLTGDTALSSTVSYATADGTATAGADYTSTSGTLTFAAGLGIRTQTVTVPIANDSLFELSEAFFLNLSGATNAVVSDAQGVGTILDDGTGPGGTDDDRPTYTIDDVTVNEGAGTLTFTVTLTGDTALSSTVAYTTADGAAGAGADFTLTSGTLTFSPGTGTRTQSVTVPITNDSLFELSETFFLNLSTVTNAVIGDAQGVGTILDDGTGPGGTDDDRPSFFVNDVTVDEGAGAATFTVTLTGDTALTATVAFATSDGAATNPGDYTTTSGTLTFGPGLGSRTQTFTVPITNDTVVESPESFTVTLSAPTNAVIGDAQGVGTILDNDASLDKLTPADTTYAIGDVVTYDIVVTLSEGLTQSLVVTDDLPVGMVFVGFSLPTTNGITNGGPLAPLAFLAPTGSGQDAVFNFGDVTVPIGAADNTFVLRIEARVLDVVGNTNGVSLANNASLNYVNGIDGTVTIVDPTPASVTVVEPALTVDKTVDDATPHLGQTVTFTVTIAHGGTSTADAFDLAVADALPAGMTLVAGSVQIASAPGYVVLTDTSAGNSVAAAFNRLNQGDTIVFTYQATLSSDPAIVGGTFGGGDDTLANTANLAYDSQLGAGPEQRTTTANDTQTVTVVGADLAVVKSDGVATVTPGAQVTYTLSVTNNGTDVATNVVVTDTLPTALGTFNAALSTAGGTLGAGGFLTYSLASLAVGATQNFTVVLDLIPVVPSGVVSLTNSASATHDDVEPTPANNSATDVDTVNAAPDLRVTKSDGLTVVRPGDTFTYTLTVANVGNQDSDAVVLTDTLPANVTIVDANGGTVAGTTVTWNLGSIAGGQTVTRTLALRLAATLPAGVNTLTNTASAADDGLNGPDLTPADNTGSDVNTVDAAPDLVVTKTDGVTVAFGDQILTYTITIRNAGNQDATGVVVTDTISPHTAFQSASDGGTLAAGVVTFPAFNLAAGATVTRTVIVRVNTTIPQGVLTLTNTAGAVDDGTNGPDQNPANNTGTDVNATGPDLEIVQTVTPGSLFVGNLATFTFVVTNRGPGPATGTVVSNALPPGLVFVSSTNPSQGTYDPASNSWTIGAMAPGASARLNVTARVQQVGEIVYTAQVTANENDPVLSNNQSSALVIGQLRPGSAISKRLFLNTPIFEDDIARSSARSGIRTGTTSAVSGIRTAEVLAPAPAVAETFAFALPTPVRVADLVPSAPFVGTQTPTFSTPTALRATDATPRRMGPVVGVADESEKSDAFEFEVPLSRELFDLGLELSSDSSAVDRIFADAPEATLPSWHEVATVPSTVMAAIRAETADEVGVPPTLDLLGEVGIAPQFSDAPMDDGAALAAATFVAPLALAVARDPKRRQYAPR